MPTLSRVGLAVQPATRPSSHAVRSSILSMPDLRVKKDRRRCFRAHFVLRRKSRLGLGAADGGKEGYRTLL